jgi:hypothetical protein
MAGGALPRVTRRGRLWRGLWPSRNPLRRTCDRVEAAFAAGLLATFLIVAPLLAMFAGQWAYGTSVRAQRAALATWHLVPATLLVGAPAQTIYCCATVRARWTAPDGTRRTGWVPAPTGAWAGSTVRVWVDRSGRRTGPPLTDSQVANRVILAAVAVPTAIAITLLGVGVLAHWVLDRRRLAAWEAEWRATGPRWTSPRLWPLAGCQGGGRLSRAGRRRCRLAHESQLSAGDATPPMRSLRPRSEMK